MTTSVLRPDSVIGYYYGVTAVGAATLWQATSDNSDSSYADWTTSAEFIMSIGSVTLPAGAVTKTLTARIRASGDRGLPLVNVRDGTPGGVGPVLASCVVETVVAIATYTGAPAAVTLAQAAIDTLYLDVFGLQGVPARCYEIYVDLVYATIPVVAPSTPTGVVSTTTTPTMQWAYTQGSDGDAQARYKIRVFTAAQYGIGGFDPATSPASYDSGEILSGSFSHVLGTLANSTTYRAYITVAQMINGVPQWSAWAYTGFSISLTTSDITTTAATVDSANGRITLLVTRNGATPTWTTLEVQRTDDGGATWNYIRGGNNVAVSGATWSGSDYESANGTTVTYRARATYLLSGLTVVGAWVSSSAVAWSSTSTWLKDPLNATLNRTVRARILPSPIRGRQQGVHVVLGRADPVVVSDVRQTIRGTVSFTTVTEAEANNLIALTASNVLLLQTPTTHRFGSRYIVIVGDLHEVRPTRSAQGLARYFEADFIEVIAP